ncbi:MAG: hypothetical protein K0U60_01525, partial [Actinomycetia bacterium]|nr:hypothetical protein [Actinomycetes bacterium]
MAAPQYRPGKYLLLLLLLIVGLTAWAFAPIDGYSVTPRLGLDLRGGTQVILDPQPITEGAEITEEQLQQSVEIIRQRVNGVGVAEADISIQGTGSDAVIVVSVPGVTQDRIVELVGRTALLDFRPVENILDPAPVGANETESADNANNKNNKKNNKNQNESASQSDAGDTGPTVSEPTDEAAEDELLQGGDIVQAKVNDAKFQQEVLALDCNDTRNQLGGTPDDPELWLGTCQRVIPDKETQAPAAKYVLKPA